MGINGQYLCISAFSNKKSCRLRSPGINAQQIRLIQPHCIHRRIAMANEYGDIDFTICRDPETAKDLFSVDCVNR